MRVGTRQVSIGWKLSQLKDTIHLVCTIHGNLLFQKREIYNNSIPHYDDMKKNSTDQTFTWQWPKRRNFATYCRIFNYTTIRIPAALHERHLPFMENKNKDFLYFYFQIYLSRILPFAWMRCLFSLFRCQSTKDFLMFSWGIERDQRHETGYRKSL